MPAVEAMTALGSSRLSANASSVTFSNIPSTDANGSAITDLYVSFSGTFTTSRYLAIQFNSDTGGNYNTQAYYANTADHIAGQVSNFSYFFASYYGSQSNAIRSGLIHIMDAKAADKHKTVLMRHNATGDSNAAVEMMAGRWANNNAITSIKVYVDSGANFASDTIISLYGVA